VIEGPIGDRKALAVEKTFDDTAINVERATIAGMDAHLVDGLADLKRCLEQMGVLAC
jgi:hypothetical protein